MTFAIPHSEAVGLLKMLECSPAAMPNFSELPPAGLVWVVVVAAGGNMFLQVRPTSLAENEHGKEAESEIEQLTVQEFYARCRPNGYGEIQVGDKPPIRFTEVVCDLCSALIAKDRHDSGIVYIVGDWGICEACATKVQQRERQRQHSADKMPGSFTINMPPGYGKTRFHSDSLD